MWGSTYPSGPSIQVRIMILSIYNINVVTFHRRMYRSLCSLEYADKPLCQEIALGKISKSKRKSLKSNISVLATTVNIIIATS